MTRTSNKKWILLEVAIFVVIVILDALGLLPITQTIYLLPFIWLTLKLQKENFRDIGLEVGQRPLWKSIVIGLLLGIILELFATYVTTPILSHFFGTEPNLSGLQGIKGNLKLLMFFISLSWLLGAFGEEICFRGFLMNRLATLFGHDKSAWVVSLLLSSILFGWGHTEQGITGWIQEGLSGLLLGISFLLSGKNLVVPIVAHGVSNTLAFILIYFGHYPGIK
jgi:membrane protease YdiL (CAAX protease family)